MRRKHYNWQLPEEIERRLGERTYGRQRAMLEAGHLLIILHAPPEADDTDRRHMVFLRMPDGRYLCNGQEAGETKLRRLLASYQEAFAKWDRSYERASSAEDLFDILEAAAPLNRSSTNLYSALQAARDYVPDDPFLIAMRDEGYEMSRNFELLLSDAKLALDYRIARNAEEQSVKAREMAKAQHKLNILAAVTFPLMAIAAIFGMGLTHGLEHHSPALFWLVVGACVAIGLITMGWVITGRD